jgi:hypothetical protein
MIFTDKVSDSAALKVKESGCGKKFMLFSAKHGKKYFVFFSKYSQLLRNGGWDKTPSYLNPRSPASIVDTVLSGALSVR